MNIGDFRDAAHKAVDWVADYLERLEDFPVLSQVQPGDIRSRLPPSAPQAPEPFEAIFRDLTDIILPGITHWQSPNFYAFFPANASGPAIIGDLISSGLGVQGMLWATSPAATELETHVLDWFVDLLDLPAAFSSTAGGGGVIQDTASSATLVALVAARERATAFASNENGITGRCTAYTSEHGHSLVDKAMGIAGLGRASLRRIDTDDAFAMRPDSLERAIEHDIRAGYTPVCVTATVGTTSSTAVDPLGPIGEICRRYDVWLHVDAALAGSAAICPEFRRMHEGLALADSYCFNPHKWLLTNFDCDCFYVADRDTLIRALSILPEYLRNKASELDEVIDYRDWQIPLGRRFRALKLWCVVRAFGVRGLQAHIRNGVALAREVAAWVDDDARFEMVAPVPLNLVCFRHVAGDEFNERLLERVNASGKAYLNHTRLRDQFVLRMAIGGTYTKARHVRATWELIGRTADALASER